MSGVVWFVDGSYAYKCWKRFKDTVRADYKKFRRYIEMRTDKAVCEACYFNRYDSKNKKFDRAIVSNPPHGAGLRVHAAEGTWKESWWSPAATVFHVSEPS